MSSSCVGFEGWGLGFEVSGFGFRVSCVGFRVFGWVWVSVGCRDNICCLLIIDGDHLIMALGMRAITKFDHLDHLDHLALGLRASGFWGGCRWA